MVVFGTNIEDDPVDLMRKVDLRLSFGGLVKSPFIGNVRRWDTSFYVLNLQPIYPDPSILGWVLLIGNALTFNVWWAYIPSGLIVLASLFWSRLFFFTLLYVMVRKAGHKGKIKLLGDQQTLRRVSQWVK